MNVTRGHFCYELGHHGDLWLELDGLFVDARRMQGWATALAQMAQEHGAPCFTLASLERQMWTAEACPLCQAGLPLTHPFEIYNCPKKCATTARVGMPLRPPG